MSLPMHTNKIFSLVDKVILITGAAKGIGFAHSRTAAAAGAHVVLCDSDSSSLETSVKQLREEGASCSAAHLDVTSERAVKTEIARIIKQYERIDALVNNAGNQNRKPFLDYSLAEWRAILDVHVTGAFLATQAVLPHMINQGSGSIIMIGSIMAQSARGTIAPYVAAKGAVTALARQIATEFGPRGIRCNVVAPGYVETELTQGLVNNPQTYNAIKSRIPLNRWGRPEDIAPAIVYLVSDAGQYVNGQVLHIDGGSLASL